MSACWCSGFPREAAVAVEIGGVRTNFRMPDVLSIGLGGGSAACARTGARIGPDWVGYELTSKALVFGGDTLTTTDIVVAAGLEEIGDPARVSASPIGHDRDRARRRSIAWPTRRSIA